MTEKNITILELNTEKLCHHCSPYSKNEPSDSPILASVKPFIEQLKNEATEAIGKFNALLTAIISNEEHTINQETTIPSVNCKENKIHLFPFHKNEG